MRKKFTKKEKSVRKNTKQLQKKSTRFKQEETATNNIRNNNIKILPKKMRLNRVVKELNMSMTRLINLLKENNFLVESNPNAIVEEDALKFLFAAENNEKLINIILSDPSYEIIEWIRKDYKNLDKLNPEKFEDLIISILKNKGFGIERSGKTNKPDGGIDFVAYKKDIVNIIIAVQIKYKINITKKVTTGEVRDFVGAMELLNYFNAGMLITNSFFTSDSRWLEEKRHNLELKDSKDIQNWINENFITAKVISREIELTKHNKIKLQF